MASNEITLTIRGNSSQLVQALSQASSAVDKFTGKAEDTGNKSARGFSKFSSAVSVAAGNLISAGIHKGIDMISNSVDGAIKRVDTLKNFPRVMSNVGISTDKAQAAIKRASDGLKGLPTSLDEAAMSIQRLTMKTKDVGRATDIFLALNNAIIAGGASSTIQSAAMEQLSQAFARGKPDLMEWRTAMTAMPAQMDQLAKSMGQVDANALYEEIKNGNITMDQLSDALIKLNTEGTGGLPTFAQQAKNATGGIATGMKNAKTAVTRGVANIIEALGSGDMNSAAGGFGVQMEKVLNKVADFIKFVKQNKEVFTAAAVAVGIFTGAVLAYETAVKLASAATKAWTTVTTIWSGVAKVAAAATTLFNLAIKNNPIVRIITIIVGAIALLVGAFIYLWNNVEGFRNFFIGAWNKIKGAAEVVGKFIGDVLKKLEPVFNTISEVVGAVAGVIADFAGKVGEALKPVVQTVISVVGSIIDTVKEIVGKIVGFFKQVADGIAAALKPVANFLAPIFDVIWRVISGLFIAIVALVAMAVEFIAKCVMGIVVVIVNVVVEIAKHIGDIVNFIIGVVSGIVSAVVGIVSTIVSVVAGAVQAYFALIGIIAGWIYDNVIQPVAQFFVDLWNGVVQGVTGFVNSVMAIVSPIADWFSTNVTMPIGNFFSGLWSGIVSGAQGFFNSVAGVLSPIANWINNNVIQPVARFFGGLWNGVLNGLSGLVRGIGSVMGTIGGIIKGPINAIISGINAVIGGINRLKVPDWVPGLGGKTPNIPTIPQLATGGIIPPTPGGQHVVVAEGGQAEWVVPESKMASLIAQVIARTDGRNGAPSKNVTINNEYNVKTQVDAQRIASDMGYLASQL
nr:MAG TPA: minor tail protein [Caudoviricetes sp.]